ncbi:hypothetical protein EYR40_010085 [Pleurotus pulmonarius]|nr:hypothetical protein EYR40_010085 [Pleurotus pulmonarius]
MSASIPALFSPIKVGRVNLQHRIALCPLTRYRATKAHTPIVPVVSEYYRQRGSAGGTLLITEGTFISPEAGGLDNVPGIWSDEQIEAWKQITDAVHAQGSYIYLQLWALGRSGNPDVLAAEGLPYVSASDIPLKSVAPRPLSVPEIKSYVEKFTTAASNAINRAGFDGVEVHGANGYLVDQFLQDVTNKRTDEYGGDVEGRTRFALEILEAVTKEVGADRTAIRISPWGKFQNMRMDDPKPTFSHLVTQIRERFPDLAYIHAVEPRIADGTVKAESEVPKDEENDFLRKLWAPRPFISAGGYTRELALKVAEEKGDIIASGKLFLSNPDLVQRWRKNLTQNAWDASTFYVPGDASGKGYIDYPFAGSE